MLLRRGLLSAVAALGLALAASAPTLAEQKITLRLGHDQVTSHTYHRAVLQFAKRVAELSNGEIEIKVSPAAQLGSETSMLDGVVNGNIDFSISTTANASSYVKKYGIFSVSFLFQDDKHFLRVLDDAEFTRMFDAITAEAKPGFHRAAFLTAGVRDYYSDKAPIAKTDDLKGIKIRIMASPIEARVWSTLGTSPVSIPSGELYTGMQTGLIQSAENSTGAYALNKHFEVAPFYSLTHHEWPISAIFMSDLTWAKLSETQKEAIRKAGAELPDFSVKDAVESDNKILGELQTKYSVKVNTVDIAPFEAKLHPLQDEVATELGTADVLARIRALR